MMQDPLYDTPVMARDDDDDDDDTVVTESEASDSRMRRQDSHETRAKLQTWDEALEGQDAQVALVHDDASCDFTIIGFILLCLVISLVMVTYLKNVFSLESTSSTFTIKKLDNRFKQTVRM